MSIKFFLFSDKLTLRWSTFNTSPLCLWLLIQYYRWQKRWGLFKKRQSGFIRAANAIKKSQTKPDELWCAQALPGAEKGDTSQSNTDPPLSNLKEETDDCCSLLTAKAQSYPYLQQLPTNILIYFQLFHYQAGFKWWTSLSNAQSRVCIYSSSTILYLAAWTALTSLYYKPTLLQISSNISHHHQVTNLAH